MSKSVIIFLVIWTAGAPVATYFITNHLATTKSNREIKKVREASEADLKIRQNKIDSLSVVIAERNKKDSLTVLQFDSLKTKLQKLNNQNIITTHETYTTVTALDLNGDIQFLSGFLDSAAAHR